MSGLDPGNRHALVVTEVFPPEVGGSGELLSNIYRRFVHTDVTVLTDGSESERVEAAGRVRVIRMPIRAQHWGLAHPVGAAHHLLMARRIRRIVSGRPTVVHTCCTLPEGLDAWLASRVSRLPYLCWAHGEELIHAGSSRELTFWLKRVHRDASALIANSQNTAGLLTRMGAPADRIHVVHPGVDVDRYRPDRGQAAELRARLLSGADVLLLTVGRLQRRKGHDVVLQALSSLVTHRPRVRYVIVGDGEERARLESMAITLGLGSHVTFVGKVESSDLPHYYAAADIFVHPNRIEGGDLEGFGMVFLEAAAMELPTVGGDSGGAPEAIQRDVTGRLVSGTDVRELAYVLAGLIDNPSQRRAMGAAGRARVVRDFSWARAAGRVQAIHLAVSSAQGDPTGEMT